MILVRWSAFWRFATGVRYVNVPMGDKSCSDDFVINSLSYFVAAKLRRESSVHEQPFVSATVWEIRFLVLLQTCCSRVCGVLLTVSAKSWLLNDDDAIHSEPRGRCWIGYS